MPLSDLFRAFDKGVSEAFVEYGTDPLRSLSAGFDELFAGFTFYHPNNPTAPVDAIQHFERLDQREEEPILWKNVNKPFADILRRDADLKNLYAGFAVLFTLDPFASAERRGSSMVVDAPLDARGIPGYSREQFRAPTPDSPLPLSAILLKSKDQSDFESVPVVFHWRKPGTRQFTETWPELASWGHVHLCCEIPYENPDERQKGLKTKVRECGFVNPITEVTCARSGFHRNELCNRLRSYAKDFKAKDSEVEARLAWTVTYFAYACECLGTMIQSKAQSPLERLAIVCAPASYDPEGSAALYVPLFYGESVDEFQRGAITILFLARALGMPLEKLKEYGTGFRGGSSQVVETFTHEAKKHIQLVKQWPQPLDAFVLSPDTADGFHLFLKTSPGQMLDPREVGIIVARDAFGAAVDEMLLWTMADTKADLPFYRGEEAGPQRLPESLMALAKEAFSVATRHIALQFVFGCRLLPNNVLKVRALLVYLDSVLPKLCNSGNAVGIPLVWSEDQGVRLTNLARLLIALFREAVEHGEWREGIEVNCESTSANLFELTVANGKFSNAPSNNPFHDCPLGEPCATAELWRIRQSLDTHSSKVRTFSHGKDEIAFLAKRAAGEVVFHGEQSGQGFKATIRFANPSFLQAPE